MNVKINMNFAKKVIHLLLLLVVVSSTAVHAKELKKGMPFLTARHALINAGWLPINVHEDKTYPYIGTENDLIDAHIKEVEHCAMDQPLCIFNYKKNDKCLRLFTRGEEIKDMRVYHWTYECSDES